MRWTAISLSDGNNTFEVEGDSYANAARNALLHLRWGLSCNEPTPKFCRCDFCRSAEEEVRAFKFGDCNLCLCHVCFDNYMTRRKLNNEVVKEPLLDIKDWDCDGMRLVRSGPAWVVDTTEGE